MAQPRNRTSIYISKNNFPVFEEIESFATRNYSIADITFEAYRLWLKKQSKAA